MSEPANAKQSWVASSFENCCKESKNNLNSNIFLRFILSLIKVYRSCVSPFLPASCRFYPTCSAYALESFQTLGLMRGSYLSLWRILKCNPLHPGGVDPVPGKSGPELVDNAVISEINTLA